MVVIPRIIGLRHVFQASPFNAFRPAQVFIREPVRDAPARTTAFLLEDDAAEQRFIERAIRQGDVILMSGVRAADTLAYAVAERAFEVGAVLLRIPREDLVVHLHGTPDDMSKVLVTVQLFMGHLFAPVTPAQLAAFRARRGLDQTELPL